MKIWLINQYNMPPEYGHLNRHFNFGKYLKRMGHEPTVFVGSFLHNTKIQMIEDDSVIRRYQNSDYPYYFIKTCDYSSSKLKRVYAMYEFYKNLVKAVKSFDKPDAILGSSAHPLAALAAIKLAKKYGCQSIVEVRDLWPESFVAFGVVGRKNPLLWLLYAGEKWIYKNADKLIFTMEGGKDYIVERGWDNENGGPINTNKIHHINNGVDLLEYNHNIEKHNYEDSDLDKHNIFNIVYVGSIRKANNLSLIIDAAKYVQENSKKNIRFLIFGDGDEKDKLLKRCTDEGIENVIFKGSVKKDYIPNILSKSNLNILNYTNHDIWKYGGSQNKTFEYLASGKPILSTIKMGYDIIEKYKVGISLSKQDPETIGKSIVAIVDMSSNDYTNIAVNAKLAAKEYDFEVLAKKLIDAIEES
jgi:glycosyltransferase involved in cell wall biosynthesis